MRLVFLGAPGVGKGTQAAHVSEECGIPHVSTGEMFRAAMSDGSELGAKVKSYVESGGLVPDDVTAALAARRLRADDCAAGFALDGFPRTVVQAEALARILSEDGLALDAVVYITASQAAIIERLSGRRMCANKECGAGYHLKYMPPKQDNVCDVCGSELYQRADDAEETIRDRLSVYCAQTEPLVAWYRERGLLREVDGSGDIDAVRRGVESILRQVAGVA